jgi:hypothetical protein
MRVSVPTVSRFHYVFGHICILDLHDRPTGLSGPIAGTRKP